MQCAPRSCNRLIPPFVVATPVSPYVLVTPVSPIRDDVQLAQLLRARDCSSNPKVVGSIPAKTQKTENSSLHGFELHRPSSKGTKLLLQVLKAIINQLYKG